MCDKTVIISAGGSGKRMKSNLPKQFLVLKNKAILAHSIGKFFDYDEQIQIIVCLPEEWFEYWNTWCKENNFTIHHKLVSGGKERYHSIKNALHFAEGKLIAIHDGVRPLVSNNTIQKAFDLAEKNGNAVPTLALKESIRFIEKESNHSLDRKNYFTVQTPQVFKNELLKKAYERDYHDAITDDASLVEEMGEKIYTFEGNEENIKITTPFDLLLAEEILKNENYD